MNVSLSQFIAAAKPGYYVPVHQQFAVGRISPVDIIEALNLTDDNLVLLESGKGDASLAQNTFIAYAPRYVFCSKDNRVTVNKELIPGVNPYQYLEQMIGARPAVQITGAPEFYGGAVGYVSYDMARVFERLPDLSHDDLQVPDLYFLFCERVIAIDNKTGLVQGVVNVPIDGSEDLTELYANAIRELAETEALLGKVQPQAEIPVQALALEHLFQPEVNITKAEFEAMVLRAKDYIMAGDVFQVNLSLRLAKKLSVQPWEVYKVLRRINPSPYGCFINFGDIQVVGSSPELLVRNKAGLAETRPIAGTRRRGKDQQEDKKLAHELIANAKERAEHIMLVDLERNDLGRVCEYGTVQVNELMVIEAYSHVMHIVSNVQGKLAKEMSNFDLLKACFPGGTITGAPKVRCMEIIEELEPTRRGIYTGSVGYFGFGGEMEMNICIRTLLIKDKQAYVQAGAGIVADSVPEREYYESLKKAEALLRAMELAERGN